MEVCYVKSLEEIIVISLIILSLVECAPVSKTQPCDPGYYSDAYSSRCKQCKVNCSMLYRKLHLECGYNHDAVCGSCLPGFRDKYSSVSLPCEKTKETKSNKEKDVPPFTIATVVPIGVGVLIVGLLLVVFVVFKNHPRVRRVIKAVCLLTRDREESQGFVSVETDAEIGPGQALLPQGDLDTDGPDHTESIVTSCDQGRPPHAELEEFRSSGPCLLPNVWCSFYLSFLRWLARYRDVKVGEAVSPQPIPSAQPNMAPSTIYQCGDSIPSTCSLCDVKGIPFQDFVGVILRRGDMYINYVSFNICHDPHELYKKLGVPHNKIYQNAEDHKVSPERYPCAQLVLNNLDDWVGVQGRPSLQILLTALCQAGFHNISRDLIEKYTTLVQP